MDENSFNKLFELVKDENLDKFNEHKITGLLLRQLEKVSVKMEVETFNNIRSLANEKQNPNLALFCLYGFLYMKMEKYLRVPADEDSVGVKELQNNIMFFKTPWNAL